RAVVAVWRHRFRRRRRRRTRSRRPCIAGRPAWRRSRPAIHARRTEPREPARRLRVGKEQFSALRRHRRSFLAATHRPSTWGVGQLAAISRLKRHLTPPTGAFENEGNAARVAAIAVPAAVSTLEAPKCR